MSVPDTPPPPLDLKANALFLDLDGTLVEIAAHPDHVRAGDELRLLLLRLLEEMNGALALITGRTIESADRVLAHAVPNIAGVHGFERRMRGGTTRAQDDLAPLVAAADEARELVRTGALAARLEDKSAGLALHFRHAPEAADAVRRIGEALAERHGLSLLEGKMVVELTLGVRNKGDAVAAFMAEAPFAGRRPIALGDDVTDEDAFAAARAFGGVAVLVGPPRLSAATHRLGAASDVLAWLAQGLER